jgi:hypothetical protein
MRASLPRDLGATHLPAARAKVFARTTGAARTPLAAAKLALRDADFSMAAIPFRTCCGVKNRSIKK